MAGNGEASDRRTGAQDGSGPGAPSINLPKGGGAIRGIGEKFAANPVTGTGSTSVPIATSPGRSGFGPQLSLSYDSGAGNGPFGFGWSLSLPQITRKTEKGLPRYHDSVESDVFILSGAEDLVPALEQDGPPRDGYLVKRYRPRIEGPFALIERWTSQSDGDVHWRSISKDNVLTVYGSDAESRIADPDEPGRVFSWLICQSYDDKGNAIVYHYVAENDDKVDFTQANERNRVGTANRYLKRICYGNLLPLLIDSTTPSFRKPHIPAPDFKSAGWMFDVLFDYGEGHYQEELSAANGRAFARATIAPPANAKWPVRIDPFSAYRAGFEVRTYRLCRRVLMFHHFPAELGVDDYLVRSTEFAYEEKPIGSFATQVIQSGYKRQTDGRYLKRSLPPLDFEYTQPIVQDAVHDIDAESMDNLPIGVDGTAYQWTDLHGEGIPGILTEQAGAWFYKRNLSPIGKQPVEFAPLELVASKPNRALAGGSAQFMDLAGDGQPDLVVLDGPMPGLYEHDDAEGWQPFRPFTSRLNRDMRDPNLKFVDLDGDGHADVLISEDDAFVWHASLAEAGFGPACRVLQERDEEKGPRLVFADGTQSIYLADLSGDGLTDLVRIRNGEVCYWPNLGYGRFGAKVTMDNAPYFDNPDQFDHKRIRLADIDGSGTTDIIYLHHDGVRLYFNQSGNGWSAPRQLNVFPRVDDLVSIVPTDLLGNGTACLVWSSPLPGDAGRQMRYVDLMGGQKPHLLIKTVNNLGAETVVHYASSTKFYLQDKRDGKPWITRLPFPVHVVERVETLDRISRNRFVTRYAYHHGYFDGEEREFRGFGLVEQWDTEEFAAPTAGGTLSADDPVGYWRLGEAPGSATAADASVHKNDGEYSGGITLGQPGFHGGDTAALFDGATARIVVPNSATLNPPKITMEAKVRWDGATGIQQRILEKESFAGTTQYGLSIGPDGHVWVELRMNKQDPATGGAVHRTATSTGNVALGAETHIVATYDGKYIRIYLNGNLDSETLDSTTFLGTAACDIDTKANNPPGDLEVALAIGDRMGEASGRRTFKGLIDEVALFDKALTANRILAHYKSQSNAATNVDAASHVPPVLTRSWFHTGAYLENAGISLHFAHEYYGAPAPHDPGYDAKLLTFTETLLPDTVLPPGLTLDEEREACRALKGSMLRQEVYALDGTSKAEHPYTVAEQNFSVRLEQPRAGNRHAVFLSHPREAITYHYERDPADPRVQHALTLEVDPFGNVLKSVAIGYGRHDPDTALTADDQEKQTKTLITYTENAVTNAIDAADAYRTPLPCETRTYELTGYPPTGATGAAGRFFQSSDFVQAAGGALTHVFDPPDVDYEDTPPSGKKRRLIERVRTLYRSDDLTSLLPLRHAEPLALPGESYKLAFTPGLLANVFKRDGQPLLLPNPADVLGGQTADRGGYVDLDSDGHWWIPSGRIFLSPDSADAAALELDYAQSHFFLPHRYRNPFHTDSVRTESFVRYDGYDLLMLETRDALGNRVTVGERRLNGTIDPSKHGNDYRVLQPRLVMDPNRNRAEVAFDTLGMVVGTAVMGKPLPAPVEGDSLDGFTADLTDAVTLDHLANPLTAPELILGRATTRLVYDLFAYQRTKAQPNPQPAVVYTLARETHDSDPAPAGGLKIQHSFSYSDGFGREIQKKIQAEPGPLVAGGPVVGPRWVGSGWTIFNNKGKPVRQYEPFFSATHRFEFGVQVGVSPILFYDPVERVVATLHPNHTWEKVVFDPWQQTTYDVNDTCAARNAQTGDPRTDPDIGGYVAEYFKTQPGVPASGLAGWWRCRDGQGLTVSDSSGNGIDGVLSGDVAFVDDPRFRKVLDFSGASGALWIPHRPSLEPETGTIAVWLKVDALQDSDVLYKVTNRWLRGSGGAGGGAVLVLRIRAYGGVEASIGNDDPSTPGVPWRSALTGACLQAGRWHHVAMRWDGREISVFVDGQKQAASPYLPILGVGLSYSGGLPVGVGVETSWGDSRSHDFIGQIAELRVYGRACSDAEIAADAPATWQTWHAQRIDGALGQDERNAALRAEAHADTPTTAHFDALGRPFLTVARNRVVCPGHDLNGTEESFSTRVELDIEGNQRFVRDAIQQAGDPLGRIVMRYDYDMLGTRIHQASMEAGARWMLNDVAGKPLYAWDSRGHSFRTEYDRLRRPLRSFVTGAELANLNQELLTDRLVYGEQHPEAELRNLRGKLYLHLDQAGSVTTEAHDFKGNPLRASRRLTNGTQYRQAVDWRSVDADHVALPTDATALLDPVALGAALAPRLEAETYTSRTTYDALNRPVTLTTPDNSVIRPGYNEANLLERVEVNLRGAAVATEFVTDIDYDAKGQRELIEYRITDLAGTPKVVRTEYAYDPLTFRLAHLKTARTTDGAVLQDLNYTYDPAGNITHIRDDAQQTIYFRNKRVEPSADYTYDAVYRLIEATGREHLGQVGGAPIPHSDNDAPRVGIDWSANDGDAMGAYIERYVYDAVGNFLQMQHRGSDPAHAGWTRAYDYLELSLIEDGSGGTLRKTSNRLTRTTLNPAGNTPQPETYQHDAHGNITSMPHLQELAWDFKDQLRMTRRQASTSGAAERTYYVYDAAGQRARKVTEDAQGRATKERFYLGGFEIYREYNGSGIRLQRETLHVMDDKQRIALVETKTRDNGAVLPNPQPLTRYQFGNHLGSASLELDAAGGIISYEEYTPYGSTSYQAVRSQTETPKRYRYTGKERDEESGFYYHGARYYAPWLGRWTACDPSGLRDGPNLFVYVSDNPTNKLDQNGKWEISWTDVAIGAGIAVVGLAAMALTAGAAAPFVVPAVAGLLGVSQATVITGAVVLGTVAGVAGTADTATEVATGRSSVTGERLSDAERSRRLGALPVEIVATALGVRGLRGPPPTIPRPPAVALLDTGTGLRLPALVPAARPITVPARAIGTGAGAPALMSAMGGGDPPEGGSGGDKAPQSPESTSSASKAKQAATPVPENPKLDELIHAAKPSTRLHAAKPSTRPELPPAAPPKMFGSQGTQLTSKTIWKAKGMRIDVENPNPGQRPGQIHFQQGDSKYLYDPTSKTFTNAPQAVNDLLKTESMQKAIAKGLNFLGEKS